MIVLVVFIGVASINIIGWDNSPPLLVTPAQLMRPVRILVFAEACPVQWVTFFCITSVYVFCREMWFIEYMYYHYGIEYGCMHILLSLSCLG